MPVVEGSARANFFAAASFSKNTAMAGVSIVSLSFSAAPKRSARAVRSSARSSPPPRDHHRECDPEPLRDRESEISALRLVAQHEIGVGVRFSPVFIDAVFQTSLGDFIEGLPVEKANGILFAAGWSLPR